MSTERLKHILEEKQMTVAFAESCTAGLASYELTRLPGSSSVFKGSVVVYSDELKQKLLNVDPKMLEDKGAVSEEVATQMARSVRDLTGSDLGVAISGIAGPDGGSDDKPVGLVYIAAIDGKHTVCERKRFSGDRDEVRSAAADRAFAVAIEVMELE